MLVAFETFVERANSARTTDELVKEFLATVRQHGLDRMIFCLQTAHDHIDMQPGVGVIQNYPEDQVCRRGGPALATVERSEGHTGKRWPHFRLDYPGSREEGRVMSRTKSGGSEHMAGHGSKFGRKKEAAIAALLSQRNHEEAAQAAGV